MSIADNIKRLKNETDTIKVQLIAVSKTKSEEEVMEAYDAGQRVFGENMVQELVDKYEHLPKDIQWHLIGHLQSNKVTKAFEVEYTYESNRIEGNTLTLQETALVIEKGLTISGNPFRNI